MKTAYRLQVLMPGTLTIFFFFFCDVGLPSEVPERYKTMRSPNYYQNFQLPTTNQPQMETLFIFHGSFKLPLIYSVCADAGKAATNVVLKNSLVLYNNFLKKHQCISENKCWISAASCVA